MANFRMRKHFACIVLPFVSLFLTLVPIQSHAIVAPSAVGFFVPGVTEATFATAGVGAAAAGGIALVGSYSLAVGAAAGYILVDYLVDDQHEVLRIPLTVSLPVPSPTAPSTAQPQTTQSYSIGGGTSQQNQACGIPMTTTSHQEICQAIICASGMTSQNGYRSDYFVYVSSTPTSCVYNYNPAYRVPVSPFTIPLNPGTVDSCPDGYSLSGSSCLLTDARQASPDKACDIQRSGSALAMISDPDCASSGTAIQEICSSGTFCQFTGKTLSGSPSTTKITPTADGGSVVQVQVARQLGNTTLVDTTSVQVSPEGVVQSVSGSTQTGSVTANGDVVAGSIDPSTGQVIPGTEVVPPDIQFPSDYAKGGDVQGLGTMLGEKLDGLNDKLGTNEDVTDPAVPDPSEMPDWGSTFDGLSGWTLPAHGSSCPTPSVDLSSVLGSGHVYVFDAHCGLIQDNFQLFQSAMVVIWTILSLLIVLRA